MRPDRALPAAPAVALLAALLAALSSCGETPESGRYSGYVEAEYIYVAAPSPGWITDETVKEGDRIDPGDLLFTLDDDQQQAAREEAAKRLSQAEAQARNLETGSRPEEIKALEAELTEARAAARLAETEKLRLSTLVARGVTAQSQLDAANAGHDEATARVRALEARIAVAKLAGREAERQAAEAAREAAAAALKQADWALDQRRVSARVAGRVEEVYLRKGEYASAAAPVLAILPPDGLKIRFFVPQSEIGGLAPGGSVSIRADALPEPVTARITFVAQEAEYTPPVIYSAESREKLVFMIEARPETAAGLRPGQPVDVRRE